MITILKRFVFSLAVLGSCATAIMAQTVVSRSSSTGGTAQSASFNAPQASAFLFQTTLADGTPALFVNWGGPSGFVAGLAPLSAARVQGGQIRLNLDAMSLLQVWYSYGTPGPCVGTFTSTTNDHLGSFFSTETTGNYASVYFNPFWPSGGIQYDSKVAGRTTESSSNFSGTCAGSTVSASPGQPNGFMKSHTGNIAAIVTIFP